VEKRVGDNARRYVKLAEEWACVVGLPASRSVWNAFQGIVQESHGSSFLDLDCALFKIAHSSLLLFAESSQYKVYDK
jgi:hypothetical protein